MTISTGTVMTMPTGSSIDAEDRDGDDDDEQRPPGDRADRVAALALDRERLEQDERAEDRQQDRQAEREVAGAGMRGELRHARPEVGGAGIVGGHAGPML